METQAFIQQIQIEEILKATDIVSLIDSYVPLKKVGSNFIGLCPFHQEKTASFYVSPSHENYHCFGCGQHGNAARFLMAKENYSFVEAMQYLAERAGIEIESTKRNSQYSAVNSLSCFLALVAQTYQKELQQTNTQSLIQTYIKKRNLSPTMVNLFELGFAPNEWHFLEKKLQEKATPSILLDCGLTKQGEKGSYDRLRNRLVFPLQDSQGRYIGFAGRTLQEKDIPKYLNPPETKLYKKSETFYGLYQAKKTIRTKQRALLVEGYLDVIRLHEQGWKETIACCGTAITQQHIYTLQREHVTSLYCIFDGDSAGQKAAYKTATLLLPTNIECYIVVLPTGSDPDSFFDSHTKADFQKLLDQSFFDYNFIISTQIEQSQDLGLEKQAATITNLQKLGEVIQDKIKRDLFLQEINRAFKLSSISLQRKSELSQKTTSITLDTEALKEPSQLYIKYPFEGKLLQYIILHPKALSLTQQVTNQYEQAILFQNQTLQKLYSLFCEIPSNEFEKLQPPDMTDIFIEQSSLITYLANSAHATWKEALNLHIIYKLIYDIVNSNYKKKLTLLEKQATEENTTLLTTIKHYSEFRKILCNLRKQKSNNYNNAVLL